MNGKSIVLRELSDSIGAVQKHDPPEKCHAFSDMRDLAIRTARIAEETYTMQKKLYIMLGLILIAVLPATGTSIADVVMKIIALL